MPTKRPWAWINFVLLCGTWGYCEAGVGGIVRYISAAALVTLVTDLICLGNGNYDARP